GGRGVAEVDIARGAVARSGAEAAGRERAVGVEPLGAAADNMGGLVPIAVGVVRAGRADRGPAAAEHIGAEVAAAQVKLPVGARRGGDRGQAAILAIGLEPD